MKTKTFKYSRRDFLKVASQSSAAMLITGYASSSSESITISPSTEEMTKQEQVEITPSPSLEEKIGQMIMVGFRGLDVNSKVIEDIRKRHVGGILLFDYDTPSKNPERNIKSPLQVRRLTKALQSYSDTPLLISIDYEGGKVNRLKKRYGFPSTVSHQYLGNKNNLAFTRQKATQMARTLSDLGINLNFAPVVDVNTNPKNPIIGKIGRSFSSNPNIVTKHAIEFIKAHRRHKILCALKHFPGHGSSAADSHLGIADVSDTWSQIELEPFANIIKAGQADSIMTAHVFNNELDPKWPATLSKSTINGLLRTELGHTGVVFSDDMQMRAIANEYGLETAVKKAIEAGVDILVIGNNIGHFDPDIAKKVTKIIKENISEQRIDESYQRILALKGKIK
jgi:beta-N-acetylhexosaminidase